MWPHTVIRAQFMYFTLGQLSWQCAFGWSLLAFVLASHPKYTKCTSASCPLLSDSCTCLLPSLANAFTLRSSCWTPVARLSRRIIEEVPCIFPSYPTDRDPCP